MLISFVGVWSIKSAAVAGKLLASSVTTSIASEVFGVIPLFVIMGLFVSVTGMGRDTFDVAAHLTRRLRGGLGIATVAANAVFAACTGTSIASASIFTKVAVPEMVRHGYRLPFAVGVVTGSSVLGMLIPPSLLDDHFRRSRKYLDWRFVHGGHLAGNLARSIVQPLYLYSGEVRAGKGV